MIPRKQIKKANLLSEGVRLLMEQGYHGTGLQSILDSVQVPKGSFYNYFPSKENFAAEVVQHYIDPFLHRLDAHLQNPEQDALSAIKHYFEDLIVESEANSFKGGCLLGNLMGEVGDTSEICKASLQQAVHRYRNALAVGLQRAQTEGTVRNDKTAEAMAELLSDTWQGALLRMKIEHSVQPLRQCCHDLLDDYFKA